MSFPHQFLSWQSEPENFNSDDLLEHNVKYFGAQKHKDIWNLEVSLFQETKVHKIIFERPVRDGVSKRKLQYANRVYGTKKRVSKTKEVSVVPDVIANDSDTNIVVTEASVDVVNVHDVSSEIIEDMVEDVLNNSIVVDVLNNSIVVVDEVEAVLIKAPDVVKHVEEDLYVLSDYSRYLLGKQEMEIIELKKAHKAAQSEKDLEIQELKNMLALERKTNQTRVEEACHVAKAGMEGMVAQLDIVRMVHAQLCTSEFYSQRMQELDDIAKVSAPKL